MGRERRAGVTDVLFLLDIIYDTMGYMKKKKRARRIWITQRQDEASLDREGYLDWYAGHRPLLYMLSLLATMLSKRCVINKKPHPIDLLCPIQECLSKGYTICAAPYACARGV